MSPEQLLKATNAVDKIITAIDNTILLGAAWDCMTEAGKAKFRGKMIKIVGLAFE